MAYEPSDECCYEGGRGARSRCQGRPLATFDNSQVDVMAVFNKAPLKIATVTERGIAGSRQGRVSDERELASELPKQAYGRKHLILSQKRDAVWIPDRQQRAVRPKSTALAVSVAYVDQS